MTIEEIITEKVRIAEDDRAEYPVICFKSNEKRKLEKQAVFSVFRGKQELSAIRLQLEQPEQKHRGQKNSQWQYQLAASSEVLEGSRWETDRYKSDVRVSYFYQNYQTCVCYHKENRFTIIEFQVKWIPSSKSLSFDLSSIDHAYQIETSVIGVKDIIFETVKTGHVTNRFWLVPLLENTAPDASNLAEAHYEITGAQLLIE